MIKRNQTLFACEELERMADIYTLGFWKPYSLLCAPSSRVSRDHENALIHHRFSTSGDSRLFILTDNIKWSLLDNPTCTGSPD